MSSPATLRPPRPAPTADRRPTARHRQALPRRHRQRRRQHRRPPRHDPRHRRRERRRQVDADEDPVRRPAAGRGHDRGQRRARSPSHSPADAIAHGIGMVFQHFMLADNLTVLENVVLGAEKLHGIGGKAARRDPADLRRLRPRPRPRRAGRGRSASASASASRSSRCSTAAREIIILDEPTAVLVPQEVDELFGNLRELKAEGLTRHLHLPQARRGALGRRRDHRHPARHHRRDGRARRASPRASSPS